MHIPVKETFLPTSAKEVKDRGWDSLDVILFTGDAYVDHPSFGAAVIGRLLEAEGLKVAIVPQPNWRDDLRDFKKLGKPRMFFGVTSGNMDSMVNHYTANIRLRSDDAYTPGGASGFRPDYAATVYSRILKQLYPDTPVILGGIEASLRRFAHYDYWSNTIKPSILIESGADIIAYGMAERTIINVARSFAGGFNMNLLRKIPQVAFLADAKYVEKIEGVQMLNSYERCASDGKMLAENFAHIERESVSVHTKTLVEPHGESFVVVNPPFALPSQAEADRPFDLPYTRLPHPRYRGKGDIPAYEMIKFSVNIHRGCFGGCSFCTISAHQGKFISSRSEASILREVSDITKMEGFKGYLSDLGGPSANMYGMGGRNRELCANCHRVSCIYPAMCANLDGDHSRLLSLYRRVRSIEGIKKAFIGSGIRYDMFIGKPDGGFLKEVILHHTSGRLKVAPEHTEDNVLKMMRKPSFDLFHKLNTEFCNICNKNGLKYQLIPYFISSHPGCREEDMRRLSAITRPMGINTEQVQDFTPTPLTLSSVIFATGIDPYSGKEVYTARSQDEKRKQKSFFFRKK